MITAQEILVAAEQMALDIEGIAKVRTQSDIDAVWEFAFSTLRAAEEGEDVCSVDELETALNAKYGDLDGVRA